MSSRLLVLPPLPVFLMGWMWFATTGGTAQAQTNLFANPSFEQGTISTANSFVDPNNAMALPNSSTVITGWETHIDSTWVLDPAHAADGDRMLWLGPPATASEDTVSSRVPVALSGDASTGLVAGNRYTITLDYVFFDPNDPTASSTADSTLAIYYALGTNAGGANPFTRFSLGQLTGEVSAWNSLDWQTINLEFNMPSIAGYDYMKFYFASPKNEGATSSRGVLLDNLSLSLSPLVVIPEPGSLLCLASLPLLLWRRRRER